MMINQHDYMKLRQTIEPVFHNKMDFANAIIKAIQTYQNDDEFCPHVVHNFDPASLWHTVIFRIDDGMITVNDFMVTYKVELVVSASEHMHLLSKLTTDYTDYKVRIQVDCDLPDSEDGKTITGYSTVATLEDPGIIKHIENGVFDRMLGELIGDITLRVQKYCVRKYKANCKTIIEPFDLEED